MLRGVASTLWRVGASRRCRTRGAVRREMCTGKRKAGPVLGVPERKAQVTRSREWFYFLFLLCTAA